MIYPYLCTDLQHQNHYSKEKKPGDAWLFCDVFVIVDYILGRTNNAFNFVNSDLDKDGTVTLSDALSVVDIILGRSQSSTPSDSD